MNGVNFLFRKFAERGTTPLQPLDTAPPTTAPTPPSTISKQVPKNPVEPRPRDSRMSTQPVTISSSANKRPSLPPNSRPAAPKPPMTIHETAIVGEHCSITGKHPITLGRSTILHPRARIYSEWGPVDIKQGVILGERSTIGGKGVGLLGITVGEGTTIEPRAVIEGEVGRDCLIGAGARVGRGAKVGDRCRISPNAVIAPEEQIPDHTSTYGRNGDLRRCVKKKAELMMVQSRLHQAEVDTLRRTIVNHANKWR